MKKSENTIWFHNGKKYLFIQFHMTIFVENLPLTFPPKGWWKGRGWGDAADPAINKTKKINSEEKKISYKSITFHLQLLCQS